jgi:hypothetical protein
MKRLFHPVVFALAVLLVFEEWLWDSLKACFRRLADHALMRALDARLRRLGPWSSLLVLLIPALVLFPFKLAALWALAHGEPMLGIAILVCAKLVGTGVAAYLFDVVRDSARQLAWFDRLYVTIITLLARAKAWLRAQPAYSAAARAIRHGRTLLASCWPASRRAGRIRRKFRAAKALLARR